MQDKMMPRVMDYSGELLKSDIIISRTFQRDGRRMALARHISTRTTTT